ncbi:hypothetical protein DFH09DRAFT_1082339 [Mycena vulgaris]|nr:hypothetical protein DFH09DRAFT_1082339 [Mycena vulgaris]
MTRTLQAVRVDWRKLFTDDHRERRIDINPMTDVKWVYDTGGARGITAHGSRRIRGFLQVLVYFRHVPRGVKPATAIFRGILTMSCGLFSSSSWCGPILGSSLTTPGTLITRFGPPNDRPSHHAGGRTLPDLTVTVHNHGGSTRLAGNSADTAGRIYARNRINAEIFAGAGRAKEATTLHLATDLKNMVTELMLKLASTINGELKNGRSQGDTDTQGDEFQYWTGLKNTFEKDLHELATVLRNGTGHGSGFSDFNVESSK